MTWSSGGDGLSPPLQPGARGYNKNPHLHLQPMGCAAFGAFCGNASCPAACPLGQPLESLCPICLCAACPTPDAGSAGSCGGTASLSGGCGEVAPFTVATATSSYSPPSGATIVLSSAQNCQSSLPSSISFAAVVLGLSTNLGPVPPGSYTLGSVDGRGARGSYVSWQTDGQGNGGGGSVPATGGTVTVDSVDLDAGTLAGSLTLDFGTACTLSGTFSTEPSTCCQ